jgi:hypothetical protein
MVTVKLVNFCDIEQWEIIDQPGDVWANQSSVLQIGEWVVVNESQNSALVVAQDGAEEGEMVAVYPVVR